MERGDLAPQRGDGSGSGELMAEISRSMVQLYKDLYGKGTDQGPHLSDR